MKKLAVIVLAIALLIVPMSITASAAGDINEYEAKVIDAISERVKVGNKFFLIPDNYVKQAENFFKTIDMTKGQSEDILALVDANKQLLIDNNIVELKELKKLPQGIKQQILDNGKDAALVVGAVLTYDGEHVTVTHNGDPIFEDVPVVKVTGAETDFTVTALAVVGIVALLAVAFVAASKKGLLSK